MHVRPLNQNVKNSMMFDIFFDVAWEYSRCAYLCGKIPQYLGFIAGNMNTVGKHMFPLMYIYLLTSDHANCSSRQAFPLLLRLENNWPNAPWNLAALGYTSLS